MLDLKDPLIVLVDNIRWEIFDKNFEKLNVFEYYLLSPNRRLYLYRQE